MRSELDLGLGHGIPTGALSGLYIQGVRRMEREHISLFVPMPVACPCALSLVCSRGPSSPERDAFSAVRVDTLEVPHLLHKDEPHERRFSQLQ